MRKIQKRCCSIWLSVVMVVMLLPVSLLAQEEQVCGLYRDADTILPCNSEGQPTSDRAIEDKTTITHLFMDEQVTVINQEAFLGCESLIFVDLGKVSKIGSKAFSGTGLTAVTLPETLVEIEKDAFDQCSKLEEVANASENEVELLLNGESKTIAAGETWANTFEITTPDELVFTVNEVASYSLLVSHVEGDVSWSVKEGSSMPDGLALSSSGVISGTPTVVGETQVTFVASNEKGTAEKTIKIHVKKSEIALASESTSWEEAVANAKEVKSPYSGIYELGSEDFINYEGEDRYGTMYKVEDLEEGETLEIEFFGVDEEVDTEIEILWLNESNGELEEMESYGEGEMPGHGERCTYTVEEDGTYYVACLGYDSDEEGTCFVSISHGGGVLLPYRALYELGSEDFIDYEGEERYGTMYKVEDLEEGEALEIEFFGVDEEVDTEIEILWLNESNGELEEMESYDEDVRNGNGESCTYTVEEDGTYYVACLGYDSDEEGMCRVSIWKYGTFEDDTLDFTGDPLPTSEEGDLWSWDDATKTLTLKDGFSLSAMDVGIILPDESTIIVEGSASVSAYKEAITSTGSLTVKFHPDAHLSLLFLEADGIEVENNLVLEGEQGDGGSLPKLTVSYAEDEGLDTGVGNLTAAYIDMDIVCDGDGVKADSGKLSLTGCKITIDTQGEGICTYSNKSDLSVSLDIIIKDCTLHIVAGEEGIESDALSFDYGYSGNITLENCDTYINTTSGEEGIHVYDVKGDIKVIGGRLRIFSQENALEVDNGTICLSEVVYDFLTTGDYKVLRFSDATSFALPGTFRLFDEEGEEIYEGEWDASLLQQDEGGYYYLGVLDDAGNIIDVYSVQCISPAEAKRNRIQGMKKTYVSGDEITFEAVGSGMGNQFPREENTRWVPTKWEVGSLSGTWTKAPYAASFSTQGLDIGEHTLIVTFTQEQYVGAKWVVMTQEISGEPIIDTKKVTFTVKEQVKPSNFSGTTKVSGNTGTGDESNGAIYIILILLAGTAFVSLFYRKKKM